MVLSPFRLVKNGLKRFKELIHTSKPLHNELFVIANEVKQSHIILIIHQIATSLTLLAMT
jgi:hypothetical protein